MVVKNCENCRHKEIVPDGPGSSTTKLICKNLWMMCYGDVRTTDDIFECIGCVGWYPEIVAPAENLDRLVSFEEIRQVTEFLGLDTNYWIERSGEYVTVEDLFKVLYVIAKQ